jgi:peptidoglycan/xylan/chitin deacetylase (PgdA/CDA1 family)
MGIFLKRNNIWIAFGLFYSFSLAGCSAITKSKSSILDRVPVLQPSETAFIAKSSAENQKSPLIIPQTIPTEPLIIIPLNTANPAPTITRSPTSTPIPTKTPYFEWNPAGYVTAPILLYHHISDYDPYSRYFVNVDEFRAQMDALQAWDYSTISASNLAKIIINGGERPKRSVIITFDDGFEDVYQNAFPILKEMGYIGVIFMYVDHIGARGYLSEDQIIELAESGWEIGSHGMSHPDLSLYESNLNYEVLQSRQILEQLPGVSVDTFAYPYGKFDNYLAGYIRDAGYLAGMALGLKWEHTIDDLYSLTRIEVQGDYDLSTFENLLPWSD